MLCGLCDLWPANTSLRWRSESLLSGLEIFHDGVRAMLVLEAKIAAAAQPGVTFTVEDSAMARVV
jgi:hypothetical protein